MKTFLVDLLIDLGENPSAWYPLIRETLACALNFNFLRRRLNITLYELALATFWFILRKRGINKFNIMKLIALSRKKLRKRILYKRILNISSYIRHFSNEYDAKEELRSIVLSTLPKLLNNLRTIHRRKSQQLPLEQYSEQLKKEVLGIIDGIDSVDLSGKSRKVIASLCIYVADKIVAQKLRIKPLLSAKMLEMSLGVSQFTILRRYKNFIKSCHTRGKSVMNNEA